MQLQHPNGFSIAYRHCPNKQVPFVHWHYLEEYCHGSTTKRFRTSLRASSTKLCLIKLILRVKLAFLKNEFPSWF